MIYTKMNNNFIEILKYSKKIYGYIRNMTILFIICRLLFLDLERLNAILNFLTKFMNN